MSNFILRPEKFDQLPQGFRAAVLDLSKRNMALLQAAFSNHAFFYFQGLPFELRRMVYVFATQSGNIRVSYEARVPKRPWSSLRLVNKQVRAEVLQVLHETKTYVLRFGTTSQLPKHHMQAAKHFRRIQIHMPVRAEGFDTYISKTRVFRALVALSTVLKSGGRPRDKSARLQISIQFHSMGFEGRHLSWGLDVLHSSRTRAGSTGISPEQYRYVALYYKTQLQWLVTEWQKQLKEFSGLVVNTNADLV